MEVTYLGKLVLGDQNTEQDWDPKRPLETCNTRDIVTKRTTANSRAASATNYRVRTEQRANLKCHETSRTIQKN